MIKFRQAILGALFLLLSTPLFAQNNYQVTLLRAAPGELGDLIEYVKMHEYSALHPFPLETSRLTQNGCGVCCL